MARDLKAYDLGAVVTVTKTVSPGISGIYSFQFVDGDEVLDNGMHLSRIDTKSIVAHTDDKTKLEVVVSKKGMVDIRIPEGIAPCNITVRAEARMYMPSLPITYTNG